MAEPRAQPDGEKAAGVEQVLYTVGHSTRSLDELTNVLRAAEVELVVDVRTAPGSRRHPQFGRVALEEGLRAAGIGYRHEPALGGFRRPRPESPNTGWEVETFRGYADHMAGQEFAQALARLEEDARERPTTIMCAEAQWWRCHRRLIADALLVRGWRVAHLGIRPTPGAEPVDHELTPFAVVGSRRELTYPRPQLELKERLEQP